MCFSFDFIEKIIAIILFDHLESLINFDCKGKSNQMKEIKKINQLIVSQQSNEKEVLDHLNVNNMNHTMRKQSDFN